MINLEKEKKNFQNHVATFTDYENIKILDFKRPDSNEYRIRFLFEEDYCRLHISGDLGHLTASNYYNMRFGTFEKHFTGNVGYFNEKIDCMDRDRYYFDEERLKEWAESEYTEKPVISKRDRAFLEYIDTRINYITRDMDGGLFIYISKPHKLIDCWESSGCESDKSLKFFKLDFPMIKWSDSEPWLIKDLKQLEVVDNYE